jgi:hypothetical protein
MNKTRKRAIQKHRAKEAKFELRRQSSGESNAGKLRASAQASPAPNRPRPPARRQPGAEAGE